MIRYFWVQAQKNWNQCLRCFYTYVHRSIIHKSQKMVETQVSINGLMDKQNVVYPYDGILFSLKRKGNSGTYCNMNEPWGFYAKRKKPVTKGHTLYESTYLGSLDESNSQRQKEGRLLGAREGRRGVFVKLGQNSSCIRWKRVLGMDGGDGWTCT